MKQKFTYTDKSHNKTIEFCATLEDLSQYEELILDAVIIDGEYNALKRMTPYSRQRFESLMNNYLITKHQQWNISSMHY